MIPLGSPREPSESPMRFPCGSRGTLTRLPWDSEALPSPLSFADELVRQAIDRGIASTVSKARKGRGLDMAMGWAWLTVHERTESDAWRFDEDSRDKGGDWVPALQALWDAASELLLNDNLDAAQDYESSMKWLAEVTGTQLPSQCEKATQTATANSATPIAMLRFFADCSVLNTLLNRVPKAAQVMTAGRPNTKLRITKSALATKPAPNRPPNAVIRTRK